MGFQTHTYIHTYGIQTTEKKKDVLINCNFIIITTQIIIFFLKEENESPQYNSGLLIVNRNAYFTKLCMYTF